MAGPKSFGRYRVTGPLGAGAMGEVHAAVDDVLGREVAIKTLHGTRSELAARLADERFRLEARAIAALTHPSVVQVFDIDLTADPPYIVMERVAGPSLKERIARGPLPDRELRALGIQIANALAAAHARGVIHRDVKPANILGAGAGSWKLADFGIAHVPDSSLTMTGQFLGSPAYAPPEALVRGQLGPASDVYGLGATLYEAAAGRWPRAHDASGALFAPAPPLRELAPSVAADLGAAIDRAIAIEPDHRPSAAALAEILAHAAVSAAPAPPDIGGLDTVALPAALPPALPAAAPAAAPTTAASYRWKHMVAGLATIAAIAAIAVSRRTPAPPTTVAPGAPAAAGSATPPPDAAVAAPVRQAPSHRAAKDWNKILDKLDERDLGGARKKLAEWEDRYGPTAESRALARQLD